jgi:hypothetical protein
METMNWNGVLNLLDSWCVVCFMMYVMLLDGGNWTLRCLTWDY